MDVRRLFIVAIILGGGWWFWTHRTKSPAPAASSASSSGSVSYGLDCVNAAETANRKVHDAAMLLQKLPVDPGAWSSAQSDVSSAISAAESACGNPASDGDRKAADEVKAALDLMRSTMSALDGAARGQGGAGASIQNQEQIDEHLNRARGSLRR